MIYYPLNLRGLMDNNYEIGIIGSGVAGMMAATTISDKTDGKKVIVFDLGRKWFKRRAQMFAFAGLLPNSDGKYYLNDLDEVKKVIPEKEVNTAFDKLNKLYNEFIDFKFISSNSPLKTKINNLKQNNYNYKLNDFVQLYPKQIHNLMKGIVTKLEDHKDIDFSFDNEVLCITKTDEGFLLNTEYGDFNCKKLLVCVGRSGWRWCSEFFNHIGIVDTDTNVKYGAYIDISSKNLSNYNNSAITLYKNNITAGPFLWNGSIIPEDHVDMAICSFRSNENRWKSDKVTIPLMCEISHKDGYEEIDRIAKLTFILTNDRICRERISTLMSGKSKVSVLKEFDIIKDAMKDLSNVVEDLLESGSFSVPAIVPLPPKVKLGTNLETEIPGLYLAGESAGISGLLAASVMGIIAGENLIGK